MSSSSQTAPTTLPELPQQHVFATPMKDRQASTSTDRSARHPHVSVSPPPHRLGSRSPNSIPSSPTSVHSSSSAIFERDIEPMLISPLHTGHPHGHALAPAHPPNPHRTPRSKTSEPIDQSVPSVLDSAATLLAAPAELEDTQIDVVSPASAATSALGSPVGRGSRSPSPTRSPAHRPSVLLAPGTGSSPPRPTLQAYFAGQAAQQEKQQQQAQAQGQGQSSELGEPIIRPSTPTSPGSTHFESAASSPTTTTLERPPMTIPRASSPNHAFNPTQQLSHPPSPSHAAAKRLSFISYTDLLASSPISTLPLSSLTSAASCEPPPHVPAVALTLPAAAGGMGGGAGSTASGATSLLDGRGGALGVFGAQPGERRSVLLDDVGGEWEREGLGKGLEERLEALMTVGPGRA